LTSIVNRIINDVISEDRESRFLMIGNKKQRWMIIKPIIMCPPELEKWRNDKL